MSVETETLSAALEASVLRALTLLYDELNQSLFKGALRRPVLSVSSSTAHLGCWTRAYRRLELSRALLLNHHWGSVREVLKHEMAHQYVQESLQVEETAHGPVFQRVCRERGIDASAVGVPEGESRVGNVGSGAKIIERIAKLLSLAQSANEHEAQAAARVAQKLMLQYNLQVDADALRGKAYTYKHVGPALSRVYEAHRILALILEEHFFVDVIWIPVWQVREGKRGSIMELCGTHENLQIASYVHAFLCTTATQLWNERRRKLGVRGQGRRLSYWAGVMTGFREQLAEQKRECSAQGLVWRGDACLSKYLRTRYPHVRRSGSRGQARDEAFAHGRQAGRKIILRRGLNQQNTGSMRYLPAGGS